MLYLPFTWWFACNWELIYHVGHWPQKYCVSRLVLHLTAFWSYPSKTFLSCSCISPPLIGIKNLNDHTSWSLFFIHYWWFKFADNWRHQGLLLPVFWPSLLSVVSSSGINSTSSCIHFTTSWFLCPEDLWLYFVLILCLTSAHGCSFPSALPNQMIICGGGCSLLSLISQNFLFLRIFVSLLFSAIGTLLHLCLWVQTSHYSFLLLYHYLLQASVPWHKCCLGYYLAVLQFNSSVSLHYLSD